MYENMIEIDRAAPESLQQQIRRQIAIGIANRLFPLHEPLPSIRRLSAELRVSATTVTLAYEGLKRDGFVCGRPGAGHFVNQNAVGEAGHAFVPPASVSRVGESGKVDYREHFKWRSFNLPRVVKPADCLVRYRYPFVCGLIDPELFPIASWRECVRDSVNAVDVGNWAADYSAIDDELLVEQLIQRVLARRGIVARPEVFFETGGFTFADERSNRNHMRLGYSVIGATRIREGIDRIANALPGAMREARRGGGSAYSAAQRGSP